MKSVEGDVKRSALQVIAVLSGLLLALTAAMVWLTSNEFNAENLLNDSRVEFGKLQQENDEATAELYARDAEIVRLRSKYQQVTTAQDTVQLMGTQERDALLAKVGAAETEAEQAGRIAGVAQEELRHAIKQSRKLEQNLETQRIQALKDKAEAQKAVRNTDGQGFEDIAALKNQLDSTLQQLTTANAKLVALRSVDPTKKESPVATPSPIPVPAKPLSSPSARQLIIKSIFGQVKAVETANQFVVIQLNTTKSVLAGDALVVTRQGIPVGILKVYRVGAQNVVFTALTPDLRDKVQVGDQVILQK